MVGTQAALRVSRQTCRQGGVGTGCRAMGVNVQGARTEHRHGTQGGMCASRPLPRGAASVCARARVSVYSYASTPG